MAIGHPAQLLGRQADGVGQGVQNHEIVTQTMHFSEF
jgi:hypothetical protein